MDWQLATQRAEEVATILVEVLAESNIEATIADVTEEPGYVLYKMAPAPGVEAAKITPPRYKPSVSFWSRSGSLNSVPSSIR